MDLLSESLAALLCGLTGVLALVAASAGRRYRDGRLLWIALAFALLSAVGAVAFVHQISPLYGGGLGVDPLPLALALASAALLYVAMVRDHRRPPRA